MAAEQKTLCEKIDEAIYNEMAEYRDVAYIKHSDAEASLQTFAETIVRLVKEHQGET